MKLSDVLARTMVDQLIVLEDMHENVLTTAMALDKEEFEIYLDYEVYGIGADNTNMLRITLDD